MRTPFFTIQNNSFAFQLPPCPRDRVAQDKALPMSPGSLPAAMAIDASLVVVAETGAHLLFGKEAGAVYAAGARLHGVDEGVVHSPNDDWRVLPGRRYVEGATDHHANPAITANK